MEISKDKDMTHLFQMGQQSHILPEVYLDIGLCPRESLVEPTSSRIRAAFTVKNHQANDQGQTEELLNPAALIAVVIFRPHHPIIKTVC